MSRFARCASALLLLAALAVAGCGGGDGTTVERTVTETVEAGAAGGPASTVDDDDPGDEDAAGDERLGDQLDDDEALPLNAFRSPSGNIGCILSGGVARCDIAKRDWTAPRPADCPPQVDAGQGLEVGRSGAAAVVCAGDTALDPGAEVLPYGRAARTGGFTCLSRPAGISCQADASGRGFFVSTQRYRLF